MQNQRPLPISRSPSGEPPYAPILWNSGNSRIKATHNCYTYMMNDLFNKPRVAGKPQPGFTQYMKNIQANNLLSNQRLTCQQVTKGVLLDNPQHIKVLSIKNGLQQRCPPNHYKGFLMVSPGNDYHFARQDNRLIAIYRRMHDDVTKKRITLPHDKTKLASLFIKYANEVLPTIVLLAHKTYPSEMMSGKPKKMLKAIANCGYTWSHKPGATDATDKDADGNMILNPMMANWNYSYKGGINYNHMCCFFSIPNNKTAVTKSTGVSKTEQNNHKYLRQNLSRENHIDSKYERLLKSACEA